MYEQSPGIEVREFFPQEGPTAERSIGYKTAGRPSNFWKLGIGDIRVGNKREIKGT